MAQDSDALVAVNPGSGEHLSYRYPEAGMGQPLESDDPGGDKRRVDETFVDVRVNARRLRIQSAGLVINATFDSSITGDPNSAAIQAMINHAVGLFEARFSDPITVSILFRYSATAPDGTPLPGTTVAQSNFVIYRIPWTSFIPALVADGKTANDATANASLPAAPLSTNVVPSSSNGRAVGLNTPAAMFANGTVGSGGPYDGIVTLNSAQSFSFTRPPTSGKFDAMQATEHEMDEVLGLGSFLNTTSSDIRPQDLFSWSSAGTRNLTTSGSRYFSINAGTTDIIGFNQNSSGDFGDWLSGSCPQVTPFVQNAFGCSGQMSDVLVASPEGINLDVIGYDLVSSLEYADAIGLYNPATATFYLRNTDSAGSADVKFPYGPASAGWVPLAGDWNGDGVDKIGLYNPTTGTFFLKNTNSAGVADLMFTYGPGGAGWTPIVGDWDGNGTVTVGLYDPATSTFFLKNSNSAGPADLVFSYGPAGAGWIPITGDWNGTGIDAVGLYDPSTGTFFLKNTNTPGPADLVFPYGPAGAGWKPLAGDWNGNGMYTIGLYNPATSTFFLRNTNSAGNADLVFSYGPAGTGWTPLAGDWDGF